jgi:uncharacterized protein CbrC (UPF0167 family)
MKLPDFRYHPDPIGSGSVVESAAQCRSCGQARGHIYQGPVYSEEELDDSLCPWCLADGSAHRKFDATFFDTEAFADGTPEAAIEEISERTPGYDSWQSGHWPCCCDDATAFLFPAGIAEIRAQCHELEGDILSHIIYNMQISGGAATRLLNALKKDAGPTVYVFRCLKCRQHHFHIDQL